MALSINGTTGISGVDGSNTAPVLKGTDANTGLSFASDTVNINTGGSTRVIIDSSGNLRAGTITDSSGSNSSTTAQIAQGRCKAWVNYDGGNVSSPRDSFNVDSITSIASGKHQINFTTAMPNDDYAFFGSSAQADEDNNNPCFCFPYQYDSQYKTTSVRIKTGYHTDNSNAMNIANRSFTSIGIFGD
tara:strand:+ start:601 stop:1164 length:564 start_codon:yes stop_codon:yes gene_type:complete